MENENNTSNLNNTNEIQQQFNNSNGYNDANFQNNNDPYASQLNSNLSSFNDNTISYNEPQLSNVDNNQFNTMPGMDSNDQFNSMPGMDSNDQFNSMPGMDSNDQFNAMPGMNSNDQFSAMPGMDSNDQFNSMPGMDSNDQFNAMPGMNSNDQFNTMPDMDSNNQFNNIPNMDPNNQFNTMPNMDPNNQFNNISNINSNDQLNNINNPDSYLMNQYSNEYDQNTNPNYNQNYNNMNYNQNANYESNDYIEPMNVPGYDKTQEQLNPQYYDSNNTPEQNINASEPQYNNIQNTDEEFVKNWMGKFYEKSNKKFNVCAFFFGPFYFLYRKVTSFGAIFLLITTILVSVMALFISTSPTEIIMTLLFSTSPTKIMMSTSIIGIIEIILAFVFGFTFNGLYKGFIKSKQNKLSTTMNTNQLLEYAKQKGGTSILGLILGIAIMIITSMVVSIIGVSMSADALRKRNTTTIPTQNTVQPPTTTPTQQLSQYTFTAGSANTTYTLSYNSTIWKLNQATNSLTLQNGDVFKYVNTYIENLSTQINTSVSTEQGRATFFNLYNNAFAQSAAQSNGTSTPSPQGFIQKGANIYYAYNDIVVNNAVTRYYLLLIPSIDMNFQFTLSSQLSSIDETENAEVEKIFETFVTPTNSSILRQTNTTDQQTSTITRETTTNTTNTTNNGTTTTNNTNTQPTTPGATNTTNPAASSTNTGTTTTPQNQVGRDYNTPGKTSPSNAITSSTTNLNSVI